MSEITEKKRRDEQGGEVYYSYAVTPWLYIAGDLQVIDTPRNEKGDAVCYCWSAHSDQVLRRAAEMEEFYR